MKTTVAFLLFAATLAAPARAERTVAIAMDDTMRYDPAVIHVKRGESVRIVATNRGKLMHEIVIGTRAQLEAHAKHMREHPGMEHHDANMLHVPPGETRTMAWRFTQPGELLYGCLEPGHFEAGMVGRIEVER
jgi:uncharacterized cupredoxin-like copper-binding protein